MSGQPRLPINVRAISGVSMKCSLAHIEIFGRRRGSRSEATNASTGQRPPKQSLRVWAIARRTLCDDTSMFGLIRTVRVENVAVQTRELQLNRGLPCETFAVFGAYGADGRIRGEYS